MGHAIHRVEHFEIIGPYTLALRFDDGTHQRIDFRPILEGEVFAPLQDLKLFNAVELDPTFGTIQWPNGADFDPETLHTGTNSSRWPANGARPQSRFAQRRANTQLEPTALVIVTAPRLSCGR